MLNDILNRAVAKRAPRDDGVALIAVMGLMLVIAILVAVLVSVGLSATSFTTASRATVQAKAAALAGIDATRASLLTGCTTPSVATTAVGSPVTGRYQVSIQVPNGTGWALGCPSSTTTQVRIVSTGTAAAQAVGTNTSGNAVTVAAVLSAGAAAPSSGSTGPAVYAYKAGAIGQIGAIRAENGSTPDVLVKTGDVDCSGVGFADVADLVVADGGVTMRGTCAIAGSVFSSDALNLSQSASVGGDAVASSVTLGGTSSIAGGVWTPGALSVSLLGSVGGNASAASLGLSGTGRIAGNAWVTGTTSAAGLATVAGTLTTKVLSGSTSPAPGRTTVKGLGTGASPYPVPSTPTVPGWLNYIYSDANWSGYTIVRLSGGTCGSSQLTAALTTIGSARGVIDARNCTGGVDAGLAQTYTIKNDLAIIANKFNLAGTSSIVGAGPANLYLISPDSGTSTTPVCPPGGGITVGGTFHFGSTLSTMIYSPCTVSLEAVNTVRGQIWASQVSISGVSSLTYVPVGLPGYDLSTGSTSSGSTRTVLSLSTVSGG